MTLLEHNAKWVETLTALCQSGDLTVSKWWNIGSQMHTVTDDYKILYDYSVAKPELDIMWDAWIKADPRPIKVNK